jgi:UV DNA damage endonuclease
MLAKNSTYPVKLGLCCSLTSTVRKTTNFTIYQSKPASQRQDYLGRIYLFNLTESIKAAEYCVQQRIPAFRLSSSMFPLASFSSAKVQIDALPHFPEILEKFAQLEKVLEGIHLSMHPDPYCSLSTEKAMSAQESINELNLHGWILDTLKRPISQECPINLHIQKTGEPEKIIEIVRDRLDRLNPRARARIVIENNDKGMWSTEHLLEYLPSLSLPLTLDFHHHKINNRGMGEKEAFFKARETWVNPEWQVCHYSEMADTTKPTKHAEFCRHHPPDFGVPYWCEIESKGKEEDIMQLLELQQPQAKR